MPESFIGDEIINFLLDLTLEFREFVQAIEEKRVKVGQNSDDSDGRMLLLVHDVIGKSVEEFGEDLNDLLRFEVFG